PGDAPSGSSTAPISDPVRPSWGGGITGLQWGPAAGDDLHAGAANAAQAVAMQENAFAPATPSAADTELLRLSGMLGAGVVRVDALGNAWPQTDTGHTLLSTLGGSEGAPLPENVRSPYF